MSALYLYVCGLIVATPLQGGGEKFRLASLAICHPPDQNDETASGITGWTQDKHIMLAPMVIYFTEIVCCKESCRNRN